MGEQWDCETIISTYTNTDNHPTILEDSSLSELRKDKRNKNTSKKHPSASSVLLHDIDENDDSSVGENVMDPSEFDLYNSGKKKVFEQKVVPVITLSRKSGVPLLHSQKYSQENILEGLRDKETDENDLYSNDFDAEDEIASLLSVSTIRKKGESKEDKLARKEAAKDLKRIARQRKKLTKQEFKVEEQSFRQTELRSKQGGTLQGSVFRYK